MAGLDDIKDKILDALDNIKDAVSDLLPDFSKQSAAERRNFIIIGSSVFALLVLAPILYFVIFSPGLRISVGLDDSAILGANFLAIENKGKVPITDMAIMLDGKYVIFQTELRAEPLLPGEVLTAQVDKFVDQETNQTAAPDYRPDFVYIESDLGEVEVDLSRPKSFLDRLGF